MMLRKTMFGLLVFAAAVVVAMSGVSYATPLLPGVTAPGPGDLFIPSDFGAVLASTGVMPWAGVLGFPTGQYEEIVVRDTITGDLDFLYQFSVKSDEVSSSSTISFSGFTTDVGDCPGCANLVPAVNKYFTASTIYRGNADVTFEWSPVITTSPTPRVSGSYVLVVATDATTWVPGYISWLDGSPGIFPGFAPGGVVPEPATMLLLGPAWLALGCTEGSEDSNGK